MQLLFATQLKTYQRELYTFLKQRNDHPRELQQGHPKELEKQL